MDRFKLKPRKRLEEHHSEDQEESEEEEVDTSTPISPPPIPEQKSSSATQLSIFTDMDRGTPNCGQSEDITSPSKKSPRITPTGRRKWFSRNKDKDKSDIKKTGLASVSVQDLDENRQEDGEVPVEDKVPDMDNQSGRRLKWFSRNKDKDKDKMDNKDLGFAPPQYVDENTQEDDEITDFNFKDITTEEPDEPPKETDILKQRSPRFRHSESRDPTSWKPRTSLAAVRQRIMLKPGQQEQKKLIVSQDSEDVDEDDHMGH